MRPRNTASGGGLSAKPFALPSSTAGQGERFGRQAPPDAVFLGRMRTAGTSGPSGVRCGHPRIPTSKPKSVNLRSLGPIFDDIGGQLVSAAVALLNWHDSARFSAVDGAPTKPVRAGWSRVNPVTGHEEFPRIDPAVICLVHDGGDRAVLARQAVWPERMFSLLAGFVEAGESSRSASPAEIPEEIGLTVRDVRYLGSQPWPFSAIADGRLPCAGRPRPGVRVQRRRDRRGGVVHSRRGSRRAGARRLEQRLGVEMLLPGSMSIARVIIESWAESRAEA